MVPVLRCILAAAMFSSLVSAKFHRQDSPDLGPGMFLIAPRRAADPNFAATVVLLIHIDESGALGLVINRPTEVRLTQLFHDIKSARKLAGTAFLGGPVQTDSALALTRTSKKTDDSSPIFDDVYLVSTRSALERVIALKPSANSFRVYLGYTGWGPGQLEHEMDLDVWRVLPADAGTVFSPDPSTVWPHLIDRTELRFAQRWNPIISMTRFSTTQ